LAHGRRSIKFRTKRIYERPDPSDGTRILVDRLWPRGVTKERATVHVWMKEIAPSPALRTWFGHAPARWLEFRKQYVAELMANEAGVCQLASLAAVGQVTLLYAARDDAHNHALVLADYLKKFFRRHSPRYNSHSP
jgi:uncharacterized protein YeaO (DUF488 family)